MTLQAKKKALIKYRDFYGGDLLGVDEVNAATTNEELAVIVDKHEDHMESMLADAKSHLSNLRDRLELNHY